MPERFIASGGARLWSIAEGTGTPLILFNGGPGCDDYLGPVADMLTQRCLVIRFEPRGCGRSDWDGRYDLQTVLQDADVIREAYGVERWIVAGHSAGVNTALAYALGSRDRTLGLVGLAGGRVVDDRSWSEAYHAARDRVGEDSGGAEFTSDEPVNTIGNASWKEYVKRPSLLRELAELDLPCTFINGSADIRPNWPTRQLAELIPKARYVELPGAGHYLWLTDGERLAEEMREALDIISSYSTPPQEEV